MGPVGEGADGPGWADELLRMLRRHTAGGEWSGVPEVVDWLGRRTGTEVALLDGAGAVESATTGFPRHVLAGLGPMRARLAAGELAAAVTEADGLRIRMEALGPRTPRPVLVVAAAPGPAPGAVALASGTGSVLALLGRAREAQAAADAYQRKAEQLRTAVFMALMSGDTTLARRMTTGAVPPLLDSERLRVHLLRCAPGDRDRIARAYQDASGYHGRDLMLRCPVYDEHLICLVSEEAGGDGAPDPAPGHAADAESTGGDGGVAPVLRRLVRENPRYSLGVSDPHPPHATADAYEQARHALAVAPGLPDRVAGHQGAVPLERVLPAGPAAAWARSLLRALDGAPRLTVDITRLALSFPKSGVARLLGVSRNTVSAHVERAGTLLGIDLDDVRGRARLTLALAVSGLHPRAAGSGSPPSLDELLCGAPATAWAGTVLGPLADAGRPEVADTLTAWIAANTDARRAAHALGTTRNTVRARLRTVEQLLRRDLLSTGAGVPDLVHALDITGRTRARPD